MRPANANRVTIVCLASLQKDAPVFNTTENWSRDVTANIVIKLLEESQQGRFVSEAARKLIERITGEQFTVTA